MINIFCPIRLKETAGLNRINEPVRIGIPFPKTAVTDPTVLYLLASDGIQRDFQAVILEFWPDKSVKWVLFDFLASIQPNTETEYSLSTSKPEGSEPAPVSRKISIQENRDSLVIDTQAVLFSLSNKGQCFDSIVIAGKELLNPTRQQLSLQDVSGKVMSVEMSPLKIEEKGTQRCSLFAKGVFKDTKGDFFVNFTIRYSFWAGLSAVQIDFLLHNPRAALHPGGLWDLGDKGSVYFNDLSLKLALKGEQSTIECQAEPSEKTYRGKNHNFTLHQNSSGGKHWDSPNHLNHRGEKTVSFSGYQATANTGEGEAIICSGQRATPWMKISDASGWIAGTLQDFWQNFPKTLRAEENTLHISLFPKEQGQPYELQGGEQKRHTIFLEFGPDGEETRIQNFQHPIHVSLSPDWLETSKALTYFSAPAAHDNEQYREYIHNIIKGEHSFFNKRERIDEYGWRNYGDIYADHEAVNYTGPEPFISHYNNQFDFLYGACIHFLKSGDRRWWELAAPAARHMIDIDVYRTDQDRSAYNGGQFWHSDHYLPVKTATHRAYSKKNKAHPGYGGGTSNEHIYSSGLTLYYFLSGDAEAREAVLLLAEYVLNMDDGTKALFALFDEGPTGLASQTVDTAFHHAGRGPGNCINCLMDAYRLSSRRKYLNKAEELVQRCIHPANDIESLNLDDPEYRWSYLVFLQVLGKYLDYKIELGETGYSFFYARDSLMHYADWMVKNEVPYKEVLHKVLLPTETWPAHDIRKCHIFHLAAQYGPEESQSTYAQRACFFHTRCLVDLLSFKTAFLTRPLVILNVYGYIHDYFSAQSVVRCCLTHNYNFGLPERFVPQRLRFKNHFIKKFKIVVKLATHMLCDKFRSIMSGN
ncbi:MAG: hypothetical protein V2B20_05765 [Pseudomonadota bacterium]